MIRNLFPKKKPYAKIKAKTERVDIPEGLAVRCPSCKKIHYTKDIEKNNYICITCGHYHQMPAYARIHSILDENSFTEFDETIVSTNPLDFPGYDKKLKKDMKNSKLNEAVVTGCGTVFGIETVIAVMDPRFRMGSMGSAVGEKITRAIEKAKEKKVPFIIFTASGGARMQEGVLSLMQMAKTSAALQSFSKNKGLFISVMTYPTTGGVSASFASLGDYNFAEPHALIGFAGRRIIEQTIREKLPDDFQTAEFLLAHGQLDKIIPREEMKQTLYNVLDIHVSKEEK
ncbi:MAG TPA: acetyl-CoA carboxylase, carboxyltransferase subunit beta [Massilibacterium sp.]|nr:acetyl-CoA carboxylase, carboxyltransferase subunit beta [Massilibacterium sp.]